MTRFSSGQEWLEQSSLLLKAYPTTTVITTKYNIPNPAKASKTVRKRKAEDADANANANANATAAAEAAPTPATLQVRAFNPQAGVVLKYATNKQQEVGRLIASLARLARVQAALPETAVEDAASGLLDVGKEEGDRAQTPVPEGKAETKPAQAAGAGGAGGGGKKKKKGKR